MANKLLLTSTVLAFATSVAYADAPMVKVGGTVDARLVTTDQTNVYERIADNGSVKNADNSHHNDRTKMVTEASVTVEAMAKADSGIEYGAEVEFDIDPTVGATTFEAEEDNDTTNTYHDGKSVRLHHANVYVKSGMGYVGLGGVKSAAHGLKVVAPSVATGGAVSGDWTDYTNMEVGYTYSDDTRTASSEKARYLTGDVLPSDASTSSKYSNKVAFYTPKMSGFQAGISYALNTTNYGGNTGASSKFSSSAYQPDGVRNDLTAAVTYEHQFSSDVLAQFSVATEFGDTKNFNATNTYKFRDIEAYELGATVSVDEFKLGATYASYGKSMNLKTVAGVTGQDEINARNNSKGYFWTVGATYVNGPVGLGANYYASKLQGNKVRAFGLAAEYALAEGLKTYIEADFFKLTPKASGVYQTTGDLGDASALATKNDGSVFLLGTKINF